MNDLSVLRVILKQKLSTDIMKAKQRQSKEVTLTVDKILNLAVNVWKKVRSSKLTIKIESI